MVAGLNTYSYVLNNPLRFIDPKGKNALVIEVAIVVSVVIVIGSAQQTQNNSSNDNDFGDSDFWDNLPNPDDYPKPDDDDGSDDSGGSGSSDQAKLCREQCSNVLGTSCDGSEAAYRECLRNCMRIAVFGF